MKAKNLNNSSKKTVRLIKTVFAQMISEKKELSKVKISELCQKADISRGTFYLHYDDIYSVAEDYENEMVEFFLESMRTYDPKDIMGFIDSVFEFIKVNNESYRLLCRANDFIYAGKRLTSFATEKLLELCKNDIRIKKQDYLETELQVFLEGLLCEYVKYCRGYSDKLPTELYDYTKYWIKNFISARCE